MKRDAFILILCILSTTTTVFSQNITATASQDTICQGETVALMAVGDNFDSYSWSPASWITNINSPNPSVTPPTSTIYTVTGVMLSDNIIVNGDFSLGNTGFATQYLYGPNTSGGTWGDLSDEGTYSVVSNPNDAHSNFANCDDHTTGFGNMLVVNGAANPNVEVWCQTVTVQPNTTYQFSTWVTSVELGSLAQLQFSINGNLLGSTFMAPSSTCVWEQFFETWDSGSSSTVEICIVNQNIAVGGNDFALDDISFAPVLTAESSVTVYVSEISGTVALQTPVDCNGNPGTASVAINGGFEPYEYLWDNGETTEEATNLSEGIHSVTVTDVAGCATIVNVQIDAPQNPVIDEVVVNHTTCGEANGALEIFAGSGLAPFQYSIDGQNFQSEATFENVAAGTFFAVIEDANGCTGAFQVTVNESSAVDFEITTPNGTDLCAEGSLLLEAGNFDSYLWSTGENTSSITPTESGNYSVMVIDADGCEGEASFEIDPCGSWQIPNAFTPNGDGVNDDFGPIIEGNVAEVLNFKIYNRWGNLVHDDINAWDGNFEGKPHPMDVLIYIIQLDTPDGVVEEKGDVSLVR